MHGDIVTPWTDRNIIPYYKDAWASIKRVGPVESWKASISYKDRRYA